MILSAIQFAPPKARPDEARSTLVRLTRQALEAGAELVVAPEMTVSGYVFANADAVRPLAEAPTGATFAALSPLASAFGATLVVGFAEEAGSALYNSAMVIGPAGELQAVYRKVLLFELDETWASAGHERMILETAALGELVPGICMDLNDEGFTRFLRSEAPDVVAFCANWLDQGFEVTPYWRRRLFGWRGWFVAANRWGEDEGVQFRGESAILAPGGRVAALAPRATDCVLLVDTESS